MKWNVLGLRIPKWKEFVFLLALLTVCGGLLSFYLISDEVREGDLRQQEEHLMRQLRDPQDPSLPIGPKWLIQGSLDITALGSTAVLMLLTFAVLLGLCLEKKWTEAAFVVFSISGGTFLNSILKSFFERERPSVVPHLANVDSLSYPSGHSMGSAIVYLTLAILLSRSIKHRPMKIYLFAIAFFLAFIVGLSRIYLGVHYPSDVMAGWAAGTVWAVLCGLLANAWYGRGTGKNHLNRPTSKSPI